MKRKDKKELIGFAIFIGLGFLGYELCLFIFNIMQNITTNPIILMRTSYIGSHLLSLLVVLLMNSKTKHK